MTRQGLLLPLHWARRCNWPTSIPHPHPRGVKALGLRYERALARQWPQVEHGPWFEFEDAAGHGYCQPDFLLSYDGATYIMEAKRTWTLEGHTKLRGLYIPVVRKALDRHVYGYQVAKILTPNMGPVVITHSTQEAMQFAREGFQVVLHWTGASVLKEAA